MEEDLAGEFRALRERCDHLITYEQQTFYQLAQALRPEWSQADVFDITTKLAHTVNQLLVPGVTADQLAAIASAPSPENKPISLFINLRGLKQLLSGVSCSLLCALASMVPMGDPQQRHSFLLSVQERFQLWSNSQLETLKAEFDKLPPYHQHAYIMQNLQDTHTPPQVCNALQALFSFSHNDLLSFKAWIEALDGASINVIANLFQFTEDFIVKVWSVLCLPLPTNSYGLGTSTDGWPTLGNSFNNPFPHMNASDDGSIGDWGRNKKRTAGGASKHIINLTDSSSGAVSLRLSSSLNVFMPTTKRSTMSSVSPSAMHEMPMAPIPDMQAHFTDHTSGHSSAFDTMLHASEAPFVSDGLRSSNWAVPPPKFYSDVDDPTGSASNKDGANSLARHFQADPSHHHHGHHHDHHMGGVDELRSANSGISGLTISQELHGGANTMMMSGQLLNPHNASFFPSTSPTTTSVVASSAMAHRDSTSASATAAAAHSTTTTTTATTGMTTRSNAPTIPAPNNQVPSIIIRGFDSIPSGHPSSAMQGQAPSSAAAPAALAHPGASKNQNNVGFVNGVRLELRITGSPPAKSVYQRILKPYPVVKVIGADKLANRVLFLKASLWNADGTEQLTCLEGGLQVAAQPTTATFKKLKVLNTSVQKGTLFKLKFQLEIFGEREQSLDIHVWSDPMEVVSHTVYLSNPNSSAPTPATVTEAIPNMGAVGSRVVIIGSSFVELPTVRVKFGDVIAHHTFHESGALIVVAPHQPSNVSRVLVSVSNDGNDYSATNAAFTYV